jgi:signal transduction histidine kinase
LLRALAAPTAGGDELRVLAEEEAALRRVATLVARGVPLEEVFAAVTEEVVGMLPVDLAVMRRYEPDGAITLMAEASGPIGVVVGESDFRSAVGTPVTVEGCRWGVIIISPSLEGPMRSGTEARLADFAGLVATAIANAESRARLARLAEEQAALRRVATLVARGGRPEEVFAAVTEEIGLLLLVEYAYMGRYEADGTITFVAAWSCAVPPVPVGSRLKLGGKNLATMVFETGRPARIAGYADASGAIGLAGRAGKLCAAVGTPIIVEGRLWGAMGAASIERPLPADTEERLAQFTELLATAIANAESRAALAASRARTVGAADDTRRRLGRDLHDGTQQQLVSLMLELRAADGAEASEVSELRAQLVRTEQRLAGVLEELREISRGIHPAILSKGGLVRALGALARRSAVPVEVDLRAERLPEHIEVAAYYVVSEALTNAAKHARASVVKLELDAHDATLQLAIRDDGIGGADPAHGSGLIGLSDRVEALGGTLQLTSAPGSGTTLLIEIPLEGQSSAGALEP